MTALPKKLNSKPRRSKRPAGTNQSAKRVVEIVSPDYQPSAAELEEDVRVEATFDEAVDALTRPVRIRYVDRPKPAE